MGLKNFFKKQLSTVIEWKDQQPDVVLCKADTPTDEVKNASKLIVATGQGCILMYEGKIQAVLTEPNVYNLDSDNHPFITSLLKIRQLFESEHKMGLYFFRTAEFVNVGWGTASPIKYMDQEYDFPIELSAYGNCSLKLTEPQRFFTEIAGAKALYTLDDLKELSISRIQPALTALLAQKGYSFKDLNVNLVTLSEEIRNRLIPEFRNFGFDLILFRLENCEMNEETMQRLNKIADIKADVLQAETVGLTYVELEKLRALRDAARNEGGIAGAGLQMGLGMEIGKILNNEKERTMAENSSDDMTQLRKLKLLLDENIITQEEFDAKKREILNL